MTAIPSNYCSDGCRTSLLIAGVVLVPGIFHTLLPPCHPYITIHFMEMIFSICSTNILIHACRIKKIMHTNTNPVFMVEGCILLKPPSDEISLFSYLVEHTYLYKTIIIVMIKKTVVIMVILFECVVCYYVACSPWYHHSDSSV